MASGRPTVPLTHTHFPPIADGPGVQVPPQGDFFWNFNGDHEKPQWSVCATATVQTQAARDLCDDPTASYGSIPCINSCVKYDTAQTQSYELPPTSDLERSYKMLPSDWAVDAKHGRLLGTVCAHLHLHLHHALS